MAHYNFKKDVIEGEAGEKIVIAHLESQGAKYISDNKDNKYDILMEMPGGKQKRFEVKTDVWCIPSRTIKAPFGDIKVDARDNGNLFVEFECRGKDSGIVVTEAEFFVTYFLNYNELWYISSNKLRKLIETENFEIKSRAGDEGSDTKGYVIPREKYNSHFNVVKHELVTANE